MGVLTHGCSILAATPTARLRWPQHASALVHNDMGIRRMHLSLLTHTSCLFRDGDLAAAGAWRNRRTISPVRNSAEGLLKSARLHRHIPSWYLSGSIVHCLLSHAIRACGLYYDGRGYTPSSVVYLVFLSSATDAAI